MTQRVRIVICLVVGLTLISTAALAAPAGTELWARRGGSPGTSELFSALVASPDGSMVFATGRTNEGRGAPPDEDWDYLTIAYDAHTGAQVWSARYDGPGSAVDIPYGIAVSPDGSKVFVTGQSAGSGPFDFDFATVAYRTSTGARLWIKRFDGKASDPFDRDSAADVAVSPGGHRVFVTGVTEGAHGVGYHILTRAYDATTGGTAWTKRFVGRTGQDEPVALAVDPDGSAVYVTGNSVGTTNHYDILTIAYGARHGDRLWNKRFNGLGADNDAATAIAVSPDGSKVIVLGDTADTTGQLNYATVAYAAATGARIWDRIYAGPADAADDSRSLAISPDGSKVVVTGTSFRPNAVWATVAYRASSGSTLWTRLWEEAGAEHTAQAVAVSPDATTVFVTGGNSPDGGFHYAFATRAYSATEGTRLWTARRSSVASEVATSIATSPDGSVVFVAGDGCVIGNCRYDYTTVAYLTE